MKHHNLSYHRQHLKELHDNKHHNPRLVHEAAVRESFSLARKELYLLEREDIHSRKQHWHKQGQEVKVSRSSK